MNVTFKAGQRTKARYKSLEDAFNTGRRPVYVVTGQRTHQLPDTLILHWSTGDGSASFYYVKGQRVQRVPKEAWWEVSVLSIQPGYAELRTSGKRVQWKEGRIK